MNAQERLSALRAARSALRSGDVAAMRKFHTLLPRDSKRMQSMHHQLSLRLNGCLAESTEVPTQESLARTDRVADKEKVATTGAPSPLRPTLAITCDRDSNLAFSVVSLDRALMAVGTRGGKRWAHLSPEHPAFATLTDGQGEANLHPGVRLFLEGLALLELESWSDSRRLWVREFRDDLERVMARLAIGVASDY